MSPTKVNEAEKKLLKTENLKAKPLTRNEFSLHLDDALC